MVYNIYNKIYIKRLNINLRLYITPNMVYNIIYGVIYNKKYMEGYIWNQYI